VDDVHAALEWLVELGASEHEPVTERGPGFVTASVVDPFGNVLGVMYNQHYLDVLAA
jgi:predicted enzyme related to lactoylglutathione lyase